MIKKYPWHIIFLIFVLICLGNIFQKIKWSAPTDNALWQHSPEGLVCVHAPEQSPLKKDDILLTVNKYVVTDKIDLHRIIRTRKSCVYEIEREGLSKNVLVDISTRYTPFSYYVLVFPGIILILMVLRILNINLDKKGRFTPPIYFYLMSLCFSGFLIFSPTGEYNVTDFVFLILDRLCFIFFPALMVHYSLYYPIKLKLVRMVNPKLLQIAIYIIPTVILVLNTVFLMPPLLNPEPELLLLSINHFRGIATDYFTFYLLVALVSFLSSNLWYILIRKQNRFILPLAGVSISISAMLIMNNLSPASLHPSSLFMTLMPFLLVFLPVSLTYYLGHRKFSDIENIIKKNLSIASIFLFIFGIFFFLGSSIEQNKLVGIFWSVAAILTAGLIFRPIEESIHRFFEKFFFRGAADFKRKLTDLIQAFRNERNLATIAGNFLTTINHGFQLQKSIFIIHYRKNVFFSLPERKKFQLSGNFCSALFGGDHLVFFSSRDFQRRYPRDYRVMREMNYFQFLPLKTQDRLIGLIAFGPKMDNTYLSVEDWDIMSNIATPLTLSVENASLYSELETQLNEISLLKEFNENIIENINVGIVVLTTLNIIKTWNDFMALKFRISAEKAIDSKAHATFSPELWKLLFKKIQNLSFASLHNIKVGVLGKDLIFDIHVSPLKDNQGKVMGTILVFEDMTEKIMIQDQLIRSEKMASLGLLAASVAHEVNTPLTGISSYCQLVLDSPDDPENNDLIAKMQEQVQRANKIVRSLLDFSRQKGEAATALDVNKIINESISLVGPSLKKKSIVIKKDYEFKHKMYGFAGRLQQMFINLFINAGDAFTDNRGEITISGIESNSDIIIRIKDNGKGIEPGDIKKIFDPFFTTKETGKGTGLGLSISYTIVQEHYGEITVTSKVNKGTTFIITFPVDSPLRSIKL